MANASGKAEVTANGRRHCASQQLNRTLNLLRLFRHIGMMACLLLLVSCQTRIDNPHAVSTAALTARKAELQERKRDDQYGIGFGAMRWISHAIDEKKSNDERTAIDTELEHRL